MGPYCNYCGRRCFLLRVLSDGRSMLLATCPDGMAHDRASCGQDHTSAVNPITDPDAAAALGRRARSANTNRTRGAERRRSYARANPDVVWPLVLAEVMVYEERHQVLGDPDAIHTVVEALVRQWVNRNVPRGNLAEFIEQELHAIELYAVVDPDDRDATVQRWRDYVAGLSAGDPVRPRRNGRRRPVGRVACMALVAIRDVAGVLTTRVCTWFGAWQIAALSDAGLVCRKRHCPIVLELTPAGQRVVAVLDAAGFPLDASRSQWLQVQGAVDAAIASAHEANAGGKDLALLNRPD